MKLKNKLIIVAMLFGNAVSAHADTLASVLYGGTNRALAACYIFNSGPGTVSILSKELISQAGAVLTLDATSNCGKTIAAGSTCDISANIGSVSGATICKFVISPSAANVRGSFDIRVVPGVDPLPVKRS
jgi:hypothetical protein